MKGERLPVSRELHRAMGTAARELRRRPTPSESMLWTALRNRQLDGAKFRRQQLIGPFVVDFFCPGQRLIVEVDGPIHETQQEYDEERQRQLEGCGYRVLRVSAAQVEQDLRGTIEIIRDALTPLPPLPREGEGVRG